MDRYYWQRIAREFPSEEALRLQRASMDRAMSSPRQRRTPSEWAEYDEQRFAARIEAAS